MDEADFESLLRVLLRNGVELIVIGGVAAFGHGAARVTYDLDIVYRRTSENYEKLVLALRNFSPYLRGAPPGLPFHWDAATIKRGLNFTLVTDIGDLDLLGEVAGGGGYDALLPFSETLILFDLECRVLSLAKLIKVKRAAGRPKDFEAIAELEVILEELQAGEEGN
jgi:hypothetical protein